MQDGNLIIDVMFDAICPWCYIGKRRLEKALADRPDLGPKIRWRPFLLNPQMPPDGIPREAYLSKKFGGEARIQRTFSAMREAGAGVGIEFAFERIERTPNTVNAHRLVQKAQEDQLGDILVETLFRAYFLDGKDTGSREVLTDLAISAGLERDTVDRLLSGQDGVTRIYEENARAHRLGINGVPSFLFNGQLAISGAQEPSVIERILDVAHAMGTPHLPLSGEAGDMSCP